MVKTHQHRLYPRVKTNSVSVVWALSGTNRVILLLRSDTNIMPFRT